MLHSWRSQVPQGAIQFYFRAVLLATTHARRALRRRCQLNRRNHARCRNRGHDPCLLPWDPGGRHEIRVAEGIARSRPGRLALVARTQRTGVSVDRETVTKWSPKENVVWVATVPGHGHSSPIVCGKRVFLTTADEAAQNSYPRFRPANRHLSGAPWLIKASSHGNIPRTRMPRRPRRAMASACSASLSTPTVCTSPRPISTARFCADAAGDFQSLHGYGSSPVLYKNLVIVNGDNVKSCYLTALDSQSGKVVWHTSARSQASTATTARRHWRPSPTGSSSYKPERPSGKF